MACQVHSAGRKTICKKNWAHTSTWASTRTNRASGTSNIVLSHLIGVVFFFFGLNSLHQRTRHGVIKWEPGGGLNSRRSFADRVGLAGLLLRRRWLQFERADSASSSSWTSWSFGRIASPMDSALSLKACSTPPT
jgi:hypothetical protein